MPAPKFLRIELRPSASAGSAIKATEIAFSSVGFDRLWQTLFGLCLGMLASETDFDKAAELDTSELKEGALS
jgi:hypothetical protein